MADIHIVYASKAQKGLSIEDVKGIVDFAAKNNQALGVTGFMCANSRYFLQCLEGEETVVESLYDKIEKDDRHHSISLIKKEEISERDFSQWNMGVVLNVDRHKEILKAYSTDGSFDPYQLSAVQSLALLKKFLKLKLLP